MLFADARASRRLAPYVTGGAGPILAYVAGRSSDEGGRRQTFGAFVGAGLDIRLSPSLSIDVSVHHNVMRTFTPPIGGHDNLNGTQVTLGIVWLFGKGNR